MYVIFWHNRIHNYYQNGEPNFAGWGRLKTARTFVEVNEATKVYNTFDYVWRNNSNVLFINPLNIKD